MMDASLYVLLAVVVSAAHASDARSVAVLKGVRRTGQFKDFDYDNLGQHTADPLLFKYQPVFEGHWVGHSASPQFDEFSNQNGWARCQFAYKSLEPSSGKMFFLEVVDGVFFCRLDIHGSAQVSRRL